MCRKLREFSLTHFWQKFRESNGFAKYCKLLKSWFDEIFLFPRWLFLPFTFIRQISPVVILGAHTSFDLVSSNRQRFSTYSFPIFSWNRWNFHTSFAYRRHFTLTYQLWSFFFKSSTSFNLFLPDFFVKSLKSLSCLYLCFITNLCSYLCVANVFWIGLISWSQECRKICAMVYFWKFSKYFTKPFSCN